MSEACTHFLTAYRFAKDKNFSADFLRGLYQGVQGPDIFFFAYDDKTKIDKETLQKGVTLPPLMQFGFKVHHSCPKNLFDRGYKYIRNTQSELIRGYFYGFLLHYVGDSNIHPYINMLAEKDKRMGTHGEAEKDIDVFVYEDYFKTSVNAWDAGKYFVTEPSDVRDISSFWEYISENTVIVEKDIKETKEQEKLIGLDEGVFSNRFKVNANEKYLNLQKAPYETAYGIKTNTVYEILDETLEEMERLYALTEESIKAHNRKFGYDFKLDFSGNETSEII